MISNNKTNRMCYLQCSEDVQEAGLCSCSNRFYEADIDETNSTKEI